MSLPDPFILAQLLIGHAIADYPLQGDFLARAKCPGGIPGIDWWIALSAHAAIHAGVVWYVTGFWQLGALEFIVHWTIDHWKCRGIFGFKVDQALHVLSKVLWAT
jgi:hypothetical protein